MNVAECCWSQLCLTREPQ